MAILFLDGAERDSKSKWTLITLDTKNISLGGVGNYCYQGGNTSYARKTFNTSQSALYGTFKWTFTSDVESDTKEFITLLDSSENIAATVTLTGNGSRYLTQIRIGNYTSSVVATGATELIKNTVYLIEFKYVPANSDGELAVKINGVADATYTGDTTAGLENVQTINFNKYSTRYGGIDLGVRLDDIVIGNSDWLGNQYVQGIVPTGAGSSTQWDPSTGSNYDCVNEVKASDTDYISTNTTDELDLYAMGNLTGIINSVTAIDICARMAYEGTPTPTKQKIAYKSGSTTAYGSEVSPNISFTDTFSGPIEVDPDTSSAWTESAINALEVGVKAVA